MNEPDSLAEKKAILKYWALVEFFSPYLLENVLDSKQAYRKIYKNQEPTSEPLPWLSAPIIGENDPVTPFVKGYNLYLALFSVEETADRARHVFTQSPSRWQSVNWQSTSTTLTCFARLTITTHGIPLFGTLTLSTLPWAHGRLLEGNKESITIEEYWKDVNRFLAQLYEGFAESLPIKIMKEPNLRFRYLDFDSLLQLTELLYDWAGYRPLGYPVALIEPLSKEELTPIKDSPIKNGRDIPILNSFYIQDLEAAAVSLNGLQGKPIDYYLAHKHERRILLDSEEGTKSILTTLRPEKVPSGRWPASLSMKLSLMQQFAINASLEAPVFSVNGPPGTGKTLLLREIIAENIVARAKALAQFETAQKAFIRRQAINFENHDPVYVNELHPTLLGYEMLVVSSNNNAVQILSQELPLRSQLDPAFKEASYLETVARKAFGLKEHEAWGLISAPLGNLENCRRFVDNVFKNMSQIEGQERIWDWIAKYEGPTFLEAKAAFLEICQRQESLSEALEQLAWLHHEVGTERCDIYCHEALDEYLTATKKTTELHRELSNLLQKENEIKEHLTLLQEGEKLWKAQRPSLLQRTIHWKNYKAWREKFRALQKERFALTEELHHCKKEIKELRPHLCEQEIVENALTETLLEQALLYYFYKEIYEKLKRKHSTAKLPTKQEPLLHGETYYQTDELNRTRSELFVAAMRLHEAWLAETLIVNGGFRGNLLAISYILQGKNPTTTEDTRLIWQSVFMLIPVISSTFASIGRLFRYLEPGSLGWVLIDEAGQAVPQAAVGAIWRAKKVLSMGDPFQIEPICTVPPEVIDGMAKMSIKDYELAWAPSQISVQNLMDRASIFGSKRTIREESHWLGSPLRVHRRCQEPMFSIANAIAYESSMLLATAQENQSSLPPSCWWHVSGFVSDRQYVPDQGKALLKLLKDPLQHMQRPDIFVISPFREVIAQIRHLLMENKELHELFKTKYPTISLQQWVQQAIGTVHTFQGKQATAVFFILGADKSTESAVEWASRKPNLLNVAVTRAQSRFYIIGDYDLWKIRPHFNIAAKQLELKEYRKEMGSAQASLSLLKNES